MADCLNRHTETAAIVTGGAQGVGYAIARQLAQEGCTRLYLAGRDVAKGERAVAELKELGAVARFVALDLQDVDACLGMVDAAVAARLEQASEAPVARIVVAVVADLGAALQLGVKQAVAARGHLAG